MALAGALGKRLVGLVLVLFLVTLFVSMLIRWVPGDPVDQIIPFPEESSQRIVDDKAELRERLNLDEPFFVQYGTWLSDFVQGDFGSHYLRSGTRPISDTVADALPRSVQLVIYSQVLALLFAVPLGVTTAHRAGSRYDRTANTTAFGLLAVPNFVLALVLSYYVGVFLGWLPTTGYTAFGADPVEHFRHMALPVITLAAGQLAVYMRLLRSDMVQTLQEDFIQTARSKGISDRRVLWRHALRPSTLTLLTVAGLNIGTLISAALVVEVLFNVGGLGTEIFSAISSREYTALQVYVAILAVFYVLANFAVDLIYTIVDPRLRHARARS